MLKYGVAFHIAGFAFRTGHNLLNRIAGPVGSQFIYWIALWAAVAHTTKQDKLRESANRYSPPPLTVEEKKD